MNWFERHYFVKYGQIVHICLVNNFYILVIVVCTSTFCVTTLFKIYSCNCGCQLSPKPETSLCFPLGAYIFIESSEPQRHRHMALLMGPRLCGRMCLQFFYHMNGKRMGTLNVYKREGMRNDDLLWTMSGHQGREWREALIDIGGACYQVYLLK